MSRTTRLHQRDILTSARIRKPHSPTWHIPLAYALGAILSGLVLPRIETTFLPTWSSGISAPAATAIYSAVATGMITLTGIVFSLAFVMVQFSATAYSPRLVLWMSRDPLVPHAIGVFTATFLYALAALAWVDRRGSGVVHFFTGWLIIGLLLASVGVFVGLIHSLGRLQINNVLAFTGDFARETIDVMYAPSETSSTCAEAAEFRHLPVTQSISYSGPPRAIQSLDIPELVRLAEQVDGIIEMLSSVGDTLVESTPLLLVYGARKLIRERDLTNAVRTGAERTFEQDPKYSIQLLRDIAIRALSPAVNDPTTAVQALDQIEDLLLRLGRRRLEIGEVISSSGSLRLVIAAPAWEDFVNLAFSEIRSYGAQSIQVMRRMNALLSDLIIALPEQRRPALRSQQTRLQNTIARSFLSIEDQVEASAEDREGLGQTRRRQTGTRCA